jgi:predicted RNase H-like HicB family nuclease
MNLPTQSPLPSHPIRVTLRITQQTTGEFSAAIVEFPEYQAQAATREAAIAAVKTAFLEKADHFETIPWDVPLPPNEDLNESERRVESPWIKYAGMFKDDPDFAEIAAAIRAEREVEDDTEVDPSVYSLEG